MAAKAGLSASAYHRWVSDAPRIPIGELARRTGVAVSAVRYYEQRGLLSAVGREAHQRVFDGTAVQLLETIHLAQRAGFSLDEIRELLQPTGDLRKLVTDKLHLLARTRADLDAAERMLLASLEAGVCDIGICRAAAPGDGLPGSDRRMSRVPWNSGSGPS